jgi:hypothetical protein
MMVEAADGLEKAKKISKPSKKSRPPSRYKNGFLWIFHLKSAL